ncbi:hypothetical protein ACFQHV_11370 [Promicromonospora thailandica]|uniref:Uncharacterized protein n=1 Tax=Promicromonospora thailandica TaxID=765201 RepID=A0A9X2G7E0_9MICO|nr:hypothetical protein [Promicromonospora thailandica]MCP2267098.1 hypothetical protein [Promicromonospora thailandica]BFF16615.1 hypothetical protein GCM10025730_01360 [Promicromonospora thailandica]
MTTNDAGQLGDESAVKDPAPAPVAVPNGAGSVTSPVLPTTAPSTTPVAPLTLDGPAVTTELELAVELADELALTLDLHGVGEPAEPAARTDDDPRDAAENATANATESGTESSTAGDDVAWHQPVQVWVDAGDVLARFGVDGWTEFDHLDRQVRALHDELGPEHERTRAATDDRDAVDALARQDEKTYQDALTDTLHEIAHERGIEVEVLPVRMARPGAGDAGSPLEAAELLATAIRRTVLPQLGRPPLDLVDDAVAAAVAAAGRTYRERIRTGERPAPVVPHDELEEQLRTELQAEELIPDDRVPPLTAGGVVIVRLARRDAGAPPDESRDLRAG